jgi:hypothetical protein
MRPSAPQVTPGPGVWLALPPERRAAVVTLLAMLAARAARGGHEPGQVPTAARRTRADFSGFDCRCIPVIHYARLPWLYMPLLHIEGILMTAVRARLSCSTLSAKSSGLAQVVAEGLLTLTTRPAAGRAVADHPRVRAAVPVEAVAPLEDLGHGHISRVWRGRGSREVAVGAVLVPIGVVASVQAREQRGLACRPGPAISSADSARVSSRWHTPGVCLAGERGVGVPRAEGRRGWPSASSPLSGPDTPHVRRAHSARGNGAGNGAASRCGRAVGRSGGAPSAP